MQKDAESEQHKQTLFMTLSGEVRRALEVMLSRKQQHGKGDLDIFFFAFLPYSLEIHARL